MKLEEDIEGKGHTTQVIGDSEVIAAIVELVD